MILSESNLCYRCERLATTRDHVPPSCFFPKSKYLPQGSKNYRDNLVTVPSCELHNNLRSRDDEYTAALFALTAGSPLSSQLLSSKWIHSLLRNEGSLGKRIFRKSHPVNVVVKEGKILVQRDTVSLTIEVERIERVLEAIARGIYFQHNNCQLRWNGGCMVFGLNLLSKELKPASNAHDLAQLDECFKSLEDHQGLGLDRRGSHPEIFYYQFFQANSGDIKIRMVFYANIVFLVFLCHLD